MADKDLDYIEFAVEKDLKLRMWMLANILYRDNKESILESNLNQSPALRILRSEYKHLEFVLNHKIKELMDVEDPFELLEKEGQEPETVGIL